jgi:hypothetical protein
MCDFERQIWYRKVWGEAPQLQDRIIRARDQLVARGTPRRIIHAQRMASEGQNLARF